MHMQQTGGRTKAETFNSLQHQRPRSLQRLSRQAHKNMAGQSRDMDSLPAREHTSKPLPWRSGAASQQEGGERWFDAAAGEDIRLAAHLCGLQDAQPTNSVRNAGANALLLHKASNCWQFSPLMTCCSLIVAFSVRVCVSVVSAGSSNRPPCTGEHVTWVARTGARMLRPASWVAAYHVLSI